MKKIVILGILALISLLLASVVSVSAAYDYDSSASISTSTSVKTSTGSASTSTSASANAAARENETENETIREKNSQGETKEDIIERINLRTGLNISLPENESLGAVLRVYLSNGRYAAVKVLPATASLKAQEVLKAKCEERNCTIELKEVKVNGTEKAAYTIETEKKAKVLGFINADMKVSADVDAETGDVIATHRPWWSFLAREEDETSVSANTAA